jgi:hypothetical protein
MAGSSAWQSETEARRCRAIPSPHIVKQIERGLFAPQKSNQHDRNIFNVIRAMHNQEYDLNIRMRNSYEFTTTSSSVISRTLRSFRSPGCSTTVGCRGPRLMWRGCESCEATVDRAVRSSHLRSKRGPNDTPLLNITPNSSVDPLKSRPAYSTAVVAAREINDRDRHDDPSQSIAYATDLKWLYMAAELMKSAGLDDYGTYRFPNGLLVGVEALAPAAAAKSPLPPEPILFGKWRD